MSVPTPAVPVRVDVLGPLALYVDGAAVDVPGKRRRAVLATLALAGGRVVTAERLVDTLWPDGPPGMRSRRCTTTPLAFDATSGRRRAACAASVAGTCSTLPMTSWTPSACDTWPVGSTSHRRRRPSFGRARLSPSGVVPHCRSSATCPRSRPSRSGSTSCDCACGTTSPRPSSCWGTPARWRRRRPPRQRNPCASAAPCSSCRPSREKGVAPRRWPPVPPTAEPWRRRPGWTQGRHWPARAGHREGRDRDRFRRRPAFRAAATGSSVGSVRRSPAGSRGDHPPAARPPGGHGDGAWWRRQDPARPRRGRRDVARTTVRPVRVVDLAAVEDVSRVCQSVASTLGPTDGRRRRTGRRRRGPRRQPAPPRPGQLRARRARLSRPGHDTRCAQPGGAGARDVPGDPPRTGGVRRPDPAAAGPDDDHRPRPCGAAGQHPCLRRAR